MLWRRRKSVSKLTYNPIDTEEYKMEKNCTNCKYFSYVIGNVSYDGICNHTKHVGRLCTEHMFCSEYERDDSKPEKVSLSLYNKVANDILLEVKPVTLRKQLIPRVIQAIDDAYQDGFSEGCDYETKIEELAKINEDLQKQVDDLSAKRKRILANKVYSDATLKKWTKDDLIEQIRILEHNWAATEEALNNSATNSEKLLYSQGEQIEQLKLELGGYINDQAIWLSKVDALEKENEQLRAMIDYATKALDKNAESRSQYIEKVKEAFDNCCCEIKPNHGCSCSCEACLASTAADVLDGILENRTKEIFEKLGKIMHKCNWDWNEPYDTVFGQEVSELAKEYGVNLTK